MGTSEKIGILLLDMGEPPEYNERTYYSFRSYVEALVNIGFVDKKVLKEDKGTILQKRENLFPYDSTAGPELVDAWLKPHKEKASTSRKKKGHPGILPQLVDSYSYLKAKGPGKGEPDFYEMYGFEVCRRWQLMRGFSPYYHQALKVKEHVKKMLEKKFEDKIAVRFAYGQDPVPHEKEQTPDVVIKDLVKKDKISHLLVAEHMNIFSDVTTTLYLRKMVEDALKEIKSKIPVSYINQLGENEAMNMGLIAKVSDELKILPERSKVMIALSNHGLPPAKVGDYDGSKDSYHENAEKVFQVAKNKITQTVKRKGRLEVVQVFVRQMARGFENDTKVLTPKRALNMAVSRGYNYYIDIPYEMPADGVHVLVKLRQSYGIDPPKWNTSYETNFPYKSLKAKITSAHFYPEYRTQAYYMEIWNVLDGLLA